MSTIISPALEPDFQNPGRVKLFLREYEDGSSQATASVIAIDSSAVAALRDACNQWLADPGQITGEKS